MPTTLDPTPTPAKQPARAAGNLPLTFMLIVLGIYILTMSGHTYSPDEETMLAASQALVTHATWELPPSKALVEVTGAGGKRYSQYGPGQSLAAVPWVLVGRLAGGLVPKELAGFPLRMTLATYNALVAAGICGLFVAAGLAFGYSRRAVLLAATALAFGTFLWPHSRTFFSEPLVGLCLFASFYLLTPNAPRWRAGLPAILSGALFALAVATKAQYAIALPAFLVYLGCRVLPLGGYPLAGGGVSPKYLITPILWFLGLALGLAPLLLYNLAVFGGALTTGYGADFKGTFKTPLSEGAVGLLLSPGKGLLWYALPVALSIWGFRRFARSHPAEAAFVGVLAVSLVTFFGLYVFWPGDGSWGPRYMMPLLPFLMLPALEPLQAASQRSPTPGGGTRLALTRLAVAALIALGILVNALGALLNFDTYINVVNDDATRYWQIEASPILGHARLLGQRVQEAVTGAFPPPGTVLFKSGFSYSEGDKSKGELLPRWTTGAGEIDVRAPDSPNLTATLRLTDHRPPELPRAQVSILVNGSPTQAQAIPVKDRPISTDYTFPLPPGASHLTIRTDTWNPSKLQDGGRNEDLGVLLESITIASAGRPLNYNPVESLKPPPYYPQPRWYYDPGTHHLADLWLVYIAEANAGRKSLLALSLPIAILGLLFIAVGWRKSVRPPSE
ncbi:MAG: hypothetical protein ACJ78Q_05380 [Chloroflexia bacterium]